MDDKAKKLAERIELLRTLINHPRTGEDERNVARHMLKRLLNKAKTAGVDTQEATGEGGWYHDSIVYGAKYDRELSTTDIAKLIRQEIKLIQKLAKKTAEPGALKTFDPIGDAPAEIKFSVCSAHFSGGSSIDISIQNIPDEWGWEIREDPYGYMSEMPTEALQTLAKELKAIMNAYNYDGSDIQTDYFNVNFYGSVYGKGGRVLA